MLKTSNQQKMLMLPRQLAPELILRLATSEDAEALSEFNGFIHTDHGSASPDVGIVHWTRDLLTKPHPTFRPEDCTVVVDTNAGKIVSSLNMIEQRWHYAGIPIEVGRIEMVGTAPEYRRRGLVRAQMDYMHALSAQRGYHLNAITGIAHYYRQFGYGMALNLQGSRIGYPIHIPKLAADKTEPYLIRPATEADVAFIAALYAENSPRSLITVERSEALWRYELSGRSQESAQYRPIKIVETLEGNAIGFFAHWPSTYGGAMGVVAYELKPGHSYRAVTPSVIRHIVGLVTAEPETENTASPSTPFQAFMFALGASHPVYEAMPDVMPRIRPPYAWYLRVPDLADFLRRIAPVLEKRLAGSALAGHTGDLRLNFYRYTLKMAFENGKLTTIAPYDRNHYEDGDAAFPEHTFLQVLFGHRMPDELRYILPDCFVSDSAAPLLNVLLPRQDSHLWPIA